MFSLAHNLPKMTSNSSKFCRKKYVQTKWIFLQSKLNRKIRNTVYFSTIETTWKKVNGNNVDFFTIEITSKKVRANNVDFSTIEITLKKVRENDVDFLISKITPKNYVEMTWKLFEVWSSKYRRNIHHESTWIWRGVSVGKLLCMHGVITLNRSNNSVFLYLKIYWNRQVLDFIRFSGIWMKPEMLRHQASSSKF